MHGKPRPTRYLSELTDIQAAVLQRMHTQIVYVEAHGDATKEHHIAKVTITGLVGRGLIEQRRDKRLRMLWKTTEAGARLIVTEEPRFLAAKSQHGYTTEPRLGMRDEPQGIDEGTQRWYTADAHDRLQGLPGRREEALRREAQNLSRRLRQEVRSVDVSSLAVVVQLERIRREIERLEELRAA